jgi:hypothetical protein
MLVVPTTVSAARIAASNSVPVGASITVRASGLKAGSYVLFLFKVLIPIHGVSGTYCWRIVGPEATAVGGRVAISAKLGGRLPCYEGLKSDGSSYRVTPGRYLLQLAAFRKGFPSATPEGELNRAITLTNSQ